MMTPAFDETGNARPLHELNVGDLIEWKRNGSTGFRRARVTGLAPKRSKPICIEPVTRDDKPSGERERWVGIGAVMHVYDRNGTRKRPHRDAGVAAEGA